MYLKNSLEPLFFGGGSLKVGHPFLGGGSLKWMESGQGGGSEKAENGWTSLVQAPLTII